MFATGLHALPSLPCPALLALHVAHSGWRETGSGLSSPFTRHKCGPPGQAIGALGSMWCYQSCMAARVCACPCFSCLELPLFASDSSLLFFPPLARPPALFAVALEDANICSGFHSYRPAFSFRTLSQIILDVDRSCQQNLAAPKQTVLRLTFEIPIEFRLKMAILSPKVPLSRCSTFTVEFCRRPRSKNLFVVLSVDSERRF
jgi:hypothetical protein